MYGYDMKIWDICWRSQQMHLRNLGHIHQSIYVTPPFLVCNAALEFAMHVRKTEHGVLNKKVTPQCICALSRSSDVNCAGSACATPASNSKNRYLHTQVLREQKVQVSRQPR